MFLRLVEFIIIVLIFWTMITQVIFPLLGGRPFFPILRREKLAIENEIAGKLEDIDLKDMREVSAKLTQNEKDAADGTLQ